MGNEMKEEANLTMKILGISENDKGIYNRINKNGFKVNECKNKKNKYILVLGINPAGDENSAEYDQNYLYYIPTITAKKGEKRFYNKYFKPIYDLFDEVTKQKIKWDWCNLEDIENIKKEIDSEVKTYMSAKKPSLETFQEVLRTVRTAEGYTSTSLEQNISDTIELNRVLDTSYNKHETFFQPKAK